MKIKRIGKSRWILAVDDIETELPSKSECMKELEKYIKKKKEKTEDKERLSRFLIEQELKHCGVK
jgi:hypothetical protein